jgi:hypothetical protein
MKHSITSLFGVAIASAALASLANANPIDGSITFSGGATINSLTADTATGVNAWQLMPTTLVSDDGTFASLGDPLPDATITAPWTFGTPVSPVVFTDFITIGAFTFDLDSSSIVSQGDGSVTVDGTGWLHDSGFTTTAATVSFTFTDPIILETIGQLHSLTVSLPSRMDHFTGTVTTIPDGGTTAALLGASLIALALVARRRSLFGD